jgi:C-8 sterol isomerase
VRYGAEPEEPLAKTIFDPDVVHECALQCLGKPKPAMFEAFGAAMDAHYPGVLDHGQPWIYSIAGGAMIQMKLYYASLHEYIMIWGTPIGSEGHSGRHFSGFWDTVIDGETWYYGEGQFEKTIYKPGDRIYVGPGQARAMNFTDGVWAVEYARGAIPYSMPFGLADELVSCLDWVTAAQTLSLYTDLVCQSIGHSRPALRASASLVSALARGVTMRLRPPPEVTAIPRDNIHFFR